MAFAVIVKIVFFYLVLLLLCAKDDRDFLFHRYHLSVLFFRHFDSVCVCNACRIHVTSHVVHTTYWMPIYKIPVCSLCRCKCDATTNVSHHHHHLFTSIHMFRVSLLLPKSTLTLSACRIGIVCHVHCAMLLFTPHPSTEWPCHIPGRHRAMVSCKIQQSFANYSNVPW